VYSRQDIYACYRNYIQCDVINLMQCTQRGATKDAEGLHNIDVAGTSPYRSAEIARDWKGFI